MNSPVSKFRQRLFLLLAATVACGTFSACHDEDHHRHTSRGYERHDDYRHDDVRHDGYRRDAYYGGSAGGTSVTVRRDAPVVRERAVTYERY
ncbi:MAG TPA: hypothetical protein VGO11_23150 [Chthoniobacteraceae bacterium]|jgi:hypothetical protein|nr:hypothetical protein [Chthoniobacteraceae bacterium]